MTYYESNKSRVVSGAMGFIRHQEEKLAAKFLRWQYDKQKLPLPSEADLMTQTARIVDEAHRIARERGGNLFEIMKGLVRDFLKKT